MHKVRKIIIFLGSVYRGYSCTAHYKGAVPRAGTGKSVLQKNAARRGGVFRSMTPAFVPAPVYLMASPRTSVRVIDEGRARDLVIRDIAEQIVGNGAIAEARVFRVRRDGDTAGIAGRKGE